MTKKTKNTVLSCVSALSGFCNALIGAGGGIILSLFMSRLMSEELTDRRDVLVLSQAAMIPGCAVSCLIYAAEGKLDTANFAVFALPALLGGALGSLLLTKIKPKWIIRIFALLVIFSGVRMLLR